MRIGHGYDIHRLGSDSPLVLGGVTFSDEPGLIAHSDGDVVLHALMDALLGAGAMGDIGQHFPPSDKQYAGADSKQLLSHVVRTLSDENLYPQHADLTIVAERPKLNSTILDMRGVIAGLLRTSLSAVNIKATTNEGLDAVGRGEAIAAYAVVLVEEKK